MRLQLFLFLMLFKSLHLQAQQEPPVQNMVFEGAGIRGIAYSGAISELEKSGVLKGIKRVGGTSAGAITALALSLGYTGDEIREMVNSTSFKKFNDGRYIFVGGINRVKKYFGWYRGQQFESWIASIITAKTGNAAITFEELHQRGFKDLYVTGTNLTKQRLMVFSFEHYPKMKVCDAVRISMSIPLYFEAVFVDSTGNIVHHPKNTNGLEVMVDGGLTGNFPIRIFDSTKYIDSSQPNRFKCNFQTIGFRIDRDAQIEQDTTSPGLAAFPVNNLKQYFGAFYNMLLENLNRQTLTEEDWHRTVSISDGKIGPKIRKLSPAEIQRLTDNGHQATATYLSAKF